MKSTRKLWDGLNESKRCIWKGHGRATDQGSMPPRTLLFCHPIIHAIIVRVYTVQGVLSADVSLLYQHTFMAHQSLQIKPPRGQIIMERYKEQRKSQSDQKLMAKEAFDTK